LSKKVVRIAPPLTITPAEATSAMSLMAEVLRRIAQDTQPDALTTVGR
jgi:acetylornithine/succinyldiaminopimelate/putrescine aminotransferase